METSQLKHKQETATASQLEISILTWNAAPQQISQKTSNKQRQQLWLQLKVYSVASTETNQRGGLCSLNDVKTSLGTESLAVSKQAVVS